MTYATRRGSLREFGADQRGSAAVDWVALAAGVLLLGIAATYALFNVGVDDLTRSIDQAMLEADCNGTTGPTIPTGLTGLEQERGCLTPGRAPDLN